MRVDRHVGNFLAVPTPLCLNSIRSRPGKLCNQRGDPRETRFNRIGNRASDCRARVAVAAALSAGPTTGRHRDRSSRFEGLLSVYDDADRECHRVDSDVVVKKVNPLDRIDAPHTGDMEGNVMGYTKKSPPRQRKLKYEYDFDETEPLSQEYHDAVTPQHIKEEIAKREP